MNGRSIISWVGLALLLAGIYPIWKATHPPLTDEQQIAATIDSTRAALEARTLRGVLGNLTDDFSWNGDTRQDFETALRGAFFEARDVQVNLSAEKIEVRADQATATAHFSASYRENADAPVETRLGDIWVHCVKDNSGTWKIDKAQGAGNVN